MKIKMRIVLSVVLVLPILSIAQDNFVLKKDIIYTPGDTLKTDIYLPANHQQQKFPTVIFADGFGSDFRKWGHYKNWVRLAAANGVITILYQSKNNEARQMLDKAFAMLCMAGLFCLSAFASKLACSQTKKPPAIAEGICARNWITCGDPDTSTRGLRQSPGRLSPAWSFYLFVSASKLAPLPNKKP